MSETLVVASVVTQNCLKEFLLTKYSCELFNTCKWYVSCDKDVKDHLHQYDNVKTLVFETEDTVSDHNSQDPQSRKQFLHIILNKFVALEKALEENNYCIFLDSDMLFLNTVDSALIEILNNKTIDFLVSPHYSRDPLNEDKHGFYNVGMFGLKDPANLTQWKYLTENCEKFNLYYEQKPFELILSNFYTLNLPINYNIGWWRFNNQRTRDRLNQLNLVDDEIMFGKLSVINFHFHVFKAPGGFNPGQFLVDKVMTLLKSSEKEEYKQILEYHGQLSEASF